MSWLGEAFSTVPTLDPATREMVAPLVREMNHPLKDEGLRHHHMQQLQIHLS